MMIDMMVMMMIVMIMMADGGVILACGNSGIEE